MNKYLLYFIVFLASFALMVMELVAGRLVAAYVGPSIYTWTSIIGVFLLGIALGNFFGGKKADKNPSFAIVGILFCLAAITSLASLFLAPLWNHISTSTFWIPGQIAFYSLLTFFLPAFFLSFTTPLVIKFHLNKIEKTGQTVGNIYGISTFGSILGTFVTGFWLIPSLGTKAIVISIFFILIAIGIFFLFKYKADLKITLLMLVLIFPLGFFAINHLNKCQTESLYFCISVDELVVQGSTEKGLVLTLDHMQHNHIYSPSFDPFGDGYIRLFASFISYNFKPNDEFSVLFIGGGGFVAPRYVIANYPKAKVTVLEIDPEVTATAYEKLGLKPDPRLTVLDGDARMSINRMRDQKFNMIFGDAFNDFLVPYQLTTKEFIENLKDHLEPNGFYAMNFIDIPADGRFLASNLLTISDVFSHTYLFPIYTNWQKNKSRQTTIVLGTENLIDSDKWNISSPYNDPLWAKASPEDKKILKTFYLLTKDELKKIASSRNGIILTDDYVPLDSMLASIYHSPTIVK